jgi:hypothetical protein
VGQEAGGFQFIPKALAQRGAGKAVNRAGRVFAVQDEDIGQKTLDGARIDLCLVGNAAAFAQPAPISHQQV